MSTDPISRASAELLAAGVTGRERLLALEVLGALIDEAGPWGMVQPDPERIAASLHSDPDSITRRIAVLDQVGAIEPCGDRWQVVGASARPHDGPSVATAMAILAGERPPSPASRSARRLAQPITAAAALVAVVMGTLAVISSSNEPPSAEQLAAVDAPRSTVGPRATSPAVPGAAAGPGTTAAIDPTTGTTPRATGSVTSLPGSSVATTAAASGCTDVILAGGVSSLGRDLSADTVATGWVVTDAGDELLLHTVVIEGHELVLPTAVPVIEPGALWAVALPAAVAEALADVEPEELVIEGRATPVSCLDA